MFAHVVRHTKYEVIGWAECTVAEGLENVRSRNHHPPNGV